VIILHVPSHLVHQRGASIETLHRVVLGLIWLTLFAVLGVGYQNHLWTRKSVLISLRTSNIACGCLAFAFRRQGLMPSRRDLSGREVRRRKAAPDRRAPRRLTARSLVWGMFELISTLFLVHRWI